jgi:hypothetical protein
MNKEQRKILAVETVDSIFTDIDGAMKRASALLGFEMSFEETLKMFENKSMKNNIAAKSDHGFVAGNTDQTYTGERRDLHKLFRIDDWTKLIRNIGKGVFSVRPDDYFYMPVHIKAATVDGVEYESVDIDSAKVVVAHVFEDKVVFNFEDVLFNGAINDKNTNEGGFQKTALCKYFNDNFIKAFDGVGDCLIENNDGKKISLPTQFEVFGAETGNCNWTAVAVQLDFFKNAKNRIRCKDNHTEWWWLSTPYASTATTLCYVGSSGAASSGNASTARGAAPCFCLC